MRTVGQHINSGVKQLSGLVLVAILLGGCGSPAPVQNAQGLAITRIKVEQRGKNEDNRPNMMGICKGFLLTENQVREFFDSSSFLREAEPSARYNILPCYSSGSALINDKPYQWVIRAGGVGEFYNDSDRFVKICGKNCCSKLPGIC